MEMPQPHQVNLPLFGRLAIATLVFFGDKTFPISKEGFYPIVSEGPKQTINTLLCAAVHTIAQERNES